MKYNAELFKKTIQTLVNDKKLKASEGKTCALASVVCIREGLIDDLFGNVEDPEKEESFSVNDLRECFAELMKQIASEGSKDGFCANASQAAKSAGFKSENVALADVDKLLADV